MKPVLCDVGVQCDLNMVDSAVQCDMFNEHDDSVPVYQDEEEISDYEDASVCDSDQSFQMDTTITRLDYYNYLS